MPYTSMNIHDANIARVSHGQRDDVKWTEIALVDPNNHLTEVTIFWEDERSLICGESDIKRRVNNAKLDELNSNVADFETACFKQILGRISSLNHLDRLPSPDDAGKRVTDAIEAFRDMANEMDNPENKERAKLHRDDVRATCYEWEQWEDSHQAELALCGGLIAALLLFEYRYTSERYMEAFTGALEGLAWWDALNR